MASWKSSKSPNIYGFMEVDMEASLKYMEEYEKKNQTKITVTHFVTKAIGMALKKHPQVNSCIRWGRIYEREQVDIFLQVSLSDGKDLSGAKIESIEEKSLAKIAEELREKAEMIRTDRDPQFKKTMGLMKKIPLSLLGVILKISDFIGNTLLWSLPTLGIPRDPFGSAMISSIGMLGIDVGFAPFPTFSRTPLIVAVGKIEDRARVVDGQVVSRKCVLLSATFDHRIVDGFQIGSFVKSVREFLENPSDAVFHHTQEVQQDNS